MELKIDDYKDYELDERVVIQIRENNEDAKDYLYEKYSPLIHKEINAFRKKARLLGIDFQDMTQEAMLGFSDAISNYDDENDSKFITFATICVRRQLSNYVAKFDTEKRKADKSMIALDASIVDDDSALLIDKLQSTMIKDPLKQLINSENLKEVSTKLDNLSNNELLALSFDLDGKSIDEISEIMDMTNKQIYNLIFRARKKLRT